MTEVCLPRPCKETVARISYAPGVHPADPVRYLSRDRLDELSLAGVLPGMMPGVLVSPYLYDLVHTEMAERANAPGLPTSTGPGSAHSR